MKTALPKKGAGRLSRGLHLAATLGDPTSIGPEVAIEAISRFLKTYPDTHLHLFGPAHLIPDKLKTKIFIHDPEEYIKFKAGRPSPESAARALRDLDRAIKFCMRLKSTALVTGPVDKFLCAIVKPTFRGHTEYLQQITKSSGTTMLLAGKKLKVALVTTHLPLSQVASSLTEQKIVDTALRTHAYLRSWIKNPRLAILGLNPHASDRGLFGPEEKRMIEPAIKNLLKQRIQASGPHSPDSFFHRLSDFVLVICMYHDQGLIPLKMLHFYDAVNITLGLPFLRVSVDHGTAFDLAGKGKASSLSYAEALNTAHAYCQTNH